MLGFLEFPLADPEDRFAVFNEPDIPRVYTEDSGRPNKDELPSPVIAKASPTLGSLKLKKQDTQVMSKSQSLKRNKSREKSNSKSLKGLQKQRTLKDKSLSPKTPKGHQHAEEEKTGSGFLSLESLNA